MKLYTVPISPNCRRSEATVHHLNIEAEIIGKDIMSGELGAEDFLALNPNGKVPTLVDGDFKLWESNAIMQYLADKSSDDTFFPKNGIERIEIIKWQFWESLHFNKSVGTICWETVAKPLMSLGDPDSNIIEGAMEDFHFFANILNNQLENRKFITGDVVTLADFSVGSLSALVLHPDSQIPLEKYPRLKNWYQRLEEVPAWDKTKPQLS